MTDGELLTEWLELLAEQLRDEIAGLSPEALAWQPDDAANNIGVTVWHVARWFDVLTVQVLENRPAAEEYWHTAGWAAQTGYDPRGIGRGGLGNVTGYTLEEVRAIPALSADELRRYLDQVCTALLAQLRALPPGALHQPTPGRGGKYTAYQWLKTLLPGSFGHVGEIQAIKALRERALAG
jgi:hypothetical protein